MSRFDSPRGSGWDLSTGLPPRPPDEDEYLGKKMVVRDGVRRCLYCHTTNLHAILHEVGPEAADRSIGCERCHGPGGHHLAAVDAGFSDLAIASPGRASAAEINTLCGKCHSMHHADAIDAPRTDPIWVRFQSITMTWSRCYTESDGALSCVTCHDPHRDRETSAAANEARCLSCHSPSPSARTSGPAPPDRPAPPSGALPAAKRCPVNPSRGCIDCHMPKTWREDTHSLKTDHFIRVHSEGATAR
jgi:formate-dependent nitrite reductase cytochrome c552 subunit